MPPRTLEAVDAEVLAFPLADPVLFRAGAAGPVVASGDLHGRLEQRLQRYGRGRVAADLWRHRWPVSLDAGALLERYRDTLKEFVQPGGEHARLVVKPDQPGAEMLAWRWLSLCLPPTTLLALRFAQRPVPRGVRLLDASLAPMEAVSILHLHFGAAHTFEDIWGHLARRAADTPMRPRVRSAHPSPDPSGLRVEDVPLTGVEVGEWRRLLHAAFLYRARVLRHERCPSHEPAPLLDCHHCGTAFGARPWLDLLRSGGGDAHDLPTLPATDADDAPASAGFEAMVESLSLAGLADDQVEASAEVAMLAAAARSPIDAELAVQYLRIRTLLYRQVVADPTCEGLNAFTGKYASMARYSHGLHDVRTDGPDVAGMGGFGLRVADLEVRVHPATWLAAVSKKQTPALPPNAYYVCHFLRRAPSDECPKFGKGFKERSAFVRKMAGAIRQQPDLLRRLRGLDVAASETAEPLWLFLPALRSLRTTSEEATHGHPGLAPLQLTLHVGEDFAHLATGLRAVWEPFEWGMMRRGDRLGHALALGLDADAWSTQNPCVPMSRWDRLLDLQFMRQLAVSQRMDIPATVLPALDAELRNLAESIVPNVTHSAGSRWEDTWCSLGEPTLLDTYPAELHGAGRLVHDFLLDAEAHRRAREIQLVESSRAEVDLLKRVQRHIEHQIRQWQVAIEVNPTSNLLIAGLGAPLGQPTFRMAPLDPGVDALPVAISTDDPAVFTTTVADEYAYAWAGMVVAGGVGPSRARAWLEEVARTSRRASFALEPVPGGPNGHDPG